MVEMGQLGDYLKEAGSSVANAFEWSLSHIESGCDNVAYYGEKAFTKSADFCAPLTQKITTLWKHYTRPFWNTTALIYRYPMSVISWHAPKTILSLEGQKKLSAQSPLYQKVDRIAKELGMTMTPDLYQKTPESFQFLPEGGWGSFFQSAVVISETSSDASIKRSLKAVHYKETTVQSLATVATAMGVSAIQAHPSIQLTAVLALWLISYVGTQVVVDRMTTADASVEEIADFKAQLNRSKIQALPENASFYAKAQRLAEIVFAGPSYLRSLAL